MNLLVNNHLNSLLRQKLGTQDNLKYNSVSCDGVIARTHVRTLKHIFMRKVTDICICNLGKKHTYPTIACMPLPTI